MTEIHVFTKRSKFTRTCIAHALLDLMSHHDIKEISIKDLVKRAGISRMTYYKYYNSKIDVLTDYMNEIVKEYMHEAKKRNDIGTFHDYEHICHCFIFFRKYGKFIKILFDANLYSILINALNNYMTTYVLPSSNCSKYELYYYAGALSNIYMKWLENDFAESPEEMATIVYSFLNNS